MITLPEIIWSGVVAAFAATLTALLTTWLNNRSQNKRQKQQLDHDIQQRNRQLQHDIDQRKTQFSNDSEQRRTDREMSLRREVYLEAAAAIGKMQEFIASSGRQDISESEKLALVQGSTAVLNKIHIVGTNRTIEVFSNAQLAFARCNSRLGKIKLDIIRKEIDIEQLQKAKQRLEEQRESQLQIAAAIAPNQRSEAAPEIRSRVMDLSRKIEEIYKSLDSAQDDLFKLQMTLVAESVTSNLEVIAAFSEASLAVREELKLGLDTEAYQIFMKDQQKQMEEVFSSFLKHVSEKDREEDDEP